MRKKTTINEIARLAEVNPSTVSRAMNSSTAHMISPAIREKIQEICDRLNYRPRISARSFVTGKTYKIGLISGYMEGDLTHPLLALYIKSLCNRLQENNYTLTLINADRGKEQDEKILSLLRSELADGYVLGAILLTPKLKEALRKSKTPIVGINFHSPTDAEGFSSVVIDYVSAYRDVWTDIPPGARVAYVGPDTKSSASKLKMIREVAPPAHASVTKIDEIFFQPNAMSIFVGRTNAMEFALKNMERLLRYRILWCTGDFTALGIADALKIHGVEPGKDIFLIGENNYEILPGFTGKPWLSTVFPQMEKAGKITAELLLDKIAAGEPHEQRISVDALYIPRDSFPRVSSKQPETVSRRNADAMGPKKDKTTQRTAPGREHFIP